MTKSLTEQWKDGELTDGIYYVSLRDSNDIHIRYLDQTKYSVYFKCFKEVLAPVPSYEEWKELVDSQKAAKKVVNSKTENRVCKLEQQLAIATKALKEYSNCKPTEWMTCVVADKALKEIEEAK